MWRRKRKKKLRIFTAKALRSILLHSFAIFKYAISHLHAYILLSLDLDYEEFSRPILDYIKIFYFLFLVDENKLGYYYINSFVYFDLL